MTVSEKVIMGIDPGTRFLGFGVISLKESSNKPSLVDFGVINLTKEGSHFLVLQKILIEVTKLLRRHKPSVIAIEAPFYGKNPQVMLKLGRAQGAAISAGLLKDIPIYEYAPRSVKLAVTGKGSATKEQVKMIVENILNFKSQVKYLDATDALAIALCHFYNEKSLSTITAQEENRLRIAKVNQKRVGTSGASDSLRVGKSSLSSIKSAGHKGGWEDFVKSNPGRTSENGRAVKQAQKKSKI